MAVQFIYGIQGSGKSFKAVKEIYDSFFNEKSSTFNKYLSVYTNIADFKHDIFNGKSFKLVPNDFIKIVSQLRLAFVQGKEENEIIELSKKLNLYNVLIVWDEAQTFLSKNNDVLLWWIEYHRHLNQDIIIIAQTPDRLKSGYKLGDLHFQAVAPSLRTSDSLKYKRFSTPELYKYSQSDTITLKPDPKIFELYKSGANEKPKKVIYKFLIIAGVLSVFLMIAIYLISDRFSSDDSNTTKNFVSTSSALSTPTPISNHSFTVACVGFDCSYLGESVTMSDLNTKEKHFNIYPHQTTQISDGVSLRTYYYNDEFIKGVFNVSISDPNFN